MFWNRNNGGVGCPTPIGEGLFFGQKWKKDAMGEDKDSMGVGNGRFRPIFCRNFICMRTLFQFCPICLNDIKQLVCLCKRSLIINLSEEQTGGFIRGVA